MIVMMGHGNSCHHDDSLGVEKCGGDQRQELLVEKATKHGATTYLGAYSLLHGVAINRPLHSLSRILE